MNKDINKDNIDTLVISGASTKVIAFLGIFRALYEKDILYSDFKNIKHISCVSIGFFYSILLSLRISERLCYECILKIDFMKFLDLDNISIDSLIQDMGFIDHSKVARPIEIILKDIFKKDNVTLKELYEKTKIKISVKCINVNRQQVEIIDHINNPEIPVLQLLLMTTAIPTFFKPIKFNDNYYVDGGINGNLPIEALDSDKYLCINICQSINKFEESEFPIIPFLLKVVCISSVSYDKYIDRTIKISLDVGTINFDISEEEKQKIINNAYKNTIQQIKDKFNVE